MSTLYDVVGEHGVLGTELSVLSVSLTISRLQFVFDKMSVIKNDGLEAGFEAVIAKASSDEHFEKMLFLFNDCPSYFDGK